MTSLQKYAWYNLGVITVSILSVAACYPFLGWRAMGCLGLLGLLGLSPFLFRKRAGQIRFDERDRLIQLRATYLAYAIFWVGFTQAAAIGSMAIYGGDGAVPVQVVQMSAVVAVLIFMTAQSIAILFQYAHDARGAE